ncbi:hypothetical protein [Anoxybacteroides tepidamans]|uniref:hypothetical protein n=1 Tax=Anoxybacteroides tepidamans TaxID=265948 RepID=UPI000480494B|nr:hypothetical protein [Anoxybacillus tepidamans]
MNGITVIIELLCSFLVLAAGLVQLKNSLRFTSVIEQESVTIQHVLRELDADFFKLLPVTFTSIACPIIIKGTHLEALGHIFFPSLAITGAIESIHYFLKDWMARKQLKIGYYKRFALAILGIVYGVFI